MERRRFLLLGAAAAVAGGCVADAEGAAPALPGYHDPHLGIRRVPAGVWGMEPLAGAYDPMSRVARITIHHSGEHLGTEHDDLTIVRAIDRYHRSRGWAGIGYHHLIGRDGALYDGRPHWVQGAHVGGGNPNNLGISVMGDFTLGHPEPAQLVTLERLLGGLLDQYGLRPDRVYGHRELGRSTCPGDNLMVWLWGWRSARNVAQPWRPPAPTRSASAPALTPSRSASAAVPLPPI